MKIKFKFQPELILPVGVLCLYMILFFPLVFFLSPTASEVTQASSGECDVYYGEFYYPCITTKEFYFTNFKIVSIVSGIIFVVLVFFEYYDKYNNQIKVYKEGEF